MEENISVTQSAENEQSKAVTVTEGNISENISYKFLSNGNLEITGSGELALADGETAPWEELAYKRIKLFGDFTCIDVKLFLNPKRIGVSAEGSTVYESVNSCLIKKEDGKKTVVLGSKNSKIPSDATAIGAYAFAGCPGIETIRLPKTAEEIEAEKAREKADLEVRNAAKAKIKEAEEAGKTPPADAVAAAKLRKKPNEFEIPQSVTEIADRAFFACPDLRSVTLTNAVEYLGEECFSECKKLENAVLSDNITVLPEKLFAGCTALCVPVLPANLKEIKDGAFARCSSFKDITLADGIKLGAAFCGCDGLKTVRLPADLEKIAAGTFARCTALTDLVIPSSAAGIDPQAFTNCKNISTIKVLDGNAKYYSENNCLIEKATSRVILGCKASVIPDGAEIIAQSAFENCVGLRKLDLPGSVKTIEKRAFAGCVSLDKITFTKGLKTIEEGAFSGCINLTGAKLPETLEKLGGSAFEYCKKLSALRLVASVTEIGNDTFRSCEKLTGVIIPQGCKKIGENAFSACKNLTSLSLPESLSELADNAFSGCELLKNLTISKDNKAFINDNSLLKTADGKVVLDCRRSVCTALDNDGTLLVSGNGAVTPDNTANGNTAENIRKIVFGDGIISIGSRSFAAHTNLRSVKISRSVTEIAKDAFDGCYRLTKIEVDKNNPVFAANGAVVTSKETGEVIIARQSTINLSLDGDTLTVSGEGKLEKEDTAQIAKDAKIRSIIFDGNIIGIGDGAFAGFTGLTFTEIPESICEIGAYCFDGCKRLAEVVTKKTLLSVGEGAFRGCARLEKITLSSAVTVLPPYVFEGCERLQKITLPRKISKICTGAFKGCTELAKPKTYEAEIEEGAFDDKQGNTAAAATEAKPRYELTGGVLTIYGDSKSTSFATYADKWSRERTAITAVIIKGKIKTVHDGAFRGFTSLKTVTLSENITNIGDRAFENCAALTGINLPEKLTYIGDYAFSGCKLSANITVPEKVNYIGTGAFSACTALSTLDISKCRIDTVPASLAKNSRNLSACIIPEDTEVIDDSAFSGCEKLRTVKLPESLKEIGASAFYGCRALDDRDFYLTDGIKSIGAAAFSDCKKLSYIDIPDGVTEICERTFFGSGLAEVNLGAVKTIARSAFEGCKKLKFVTLPDSLKTIEDYAFWRCNALTDINIPEKAVVGEKAFLGCDSLKLG